jgi:hypothetical protein
MNKDILYSYLVLYGIQSELNIRLHDPEQFVNWTEENFEYVRYNPRKPIDRWGLSITSYDGGLSGIPDLDSLGDYCIENNVSLEESDFNVPTEVYKQSKELQEVLEPFKENCYRTHILKLNPGSYFPKHRDLRLDNFNHFRLIMPLKNPCTFVIEDKILTWDVGTMYFVDTAKVHYLFNATHDPSYWLVLNVELTEEVYEEVTKHFVYKA